MKISLLAVLCMLLGFMNTIPTQGYQDVGSEFGASWLEKYGTMPTSTLETQNNLWNWGSAPKGYSLRNGTLYPPGTAPQWYYPASLTSFIPIVINQSESSNLQSAYAGTDPWLLSQLSGRPVSVIYDPAGTLF